MAARHRRPLYSSLSSKFANTFSDSVSDINPYQPPSELEEKVDIANILYQTPRVLEELDPIRFSGSVGTRELSRHLSKDQDSLGFTFPVLGSLTLAFALLWSVMMGQPSVMLAVFGICTLGTLVLVTSSRSYRNMVFQSSFPMWDQPISGELTQKGLHVESESESVFYQWNWFSGVTINEGVVGFVPSILSEPPVLIGTNMLSGMAGAEELYEFSRKAKAVCLSEHANEQIAFANRQVMRSSERLRTAPVAKDSIKFEGRITGADTQLVPRKAIQRQNTERAVIIRFVIVVGIGMIVASLMTNWYSGSLALAAISILAWQRTFRQKRSPAANKNLYYLIGDADAEGITTDFHIARTKVRWSGIRVVEQAAQHVVLSRKQPRKIMVLRQDMFADEQQWQAFLRILP